MNTSNSKLLENKSFMELDGLVGLPSLPNGVKPAPMKYNLGKINKYLNETGKEFKELTVLELKQFERVK